jgi:hypothetical protein
MLLLALFFFENSNAVVVPNGTMPPKFDPFKIKARDIEKITGKKLTLFQKVKLKIAQTVLKKYSNGEITEKQRKQARISMILGLVGIGLLLISLSPFVGFLGILSIPAAILAVIFGSKSLKGNSNTEGVIGVVTGGVTLALILLVLVLVAIVLSSGFYI